eukprot:GHVT01075779.1.p2 GENE.GHVT01075779.1~~GHVT01075779.1.p2  ORF type:complete len:213 (+),score=44.75 GHVT01075779.1:875-1513(+)
MGKTAPKPPALKRPAVGASGRAAKRTRPDASLPSPETASATATKEVKHASCEGPVAPSAAELSQRLRAVALTLASDDSMAYRTGREKECAQMSTLLKRMVARKRGGAVYLYGPSGSGKTFTATDVLTKLIETQGKQSKAKTAAARGPPPALIRLRGSGFPDGLSLFAELAHRIFNRPVRIALAEFKRALQRNGRKGLVEAFTKQFHNHKTLK